MSFLGRLIACYAVADQESKPIKHSDQTAYTGVPHSCGSLDGAMLYTQKAGASYMQ